MSHRDDRIILAVAGLLLFIITVASVVDRFRPGETPAGGERVTIEHRGAEPGWANLPEDWEERHAFYHLRGIPHGHPQDQEETSRAEAAWAEELQRRQAVQKNR